MISPFLPVALVLVAAPHPFQEPLEEYQVLAKVIRHFLALVTWPMPPDRPLKFAVIGGNGFGTDLDVSFSRGPVGGRKVVLKYLSSGAYLADGESYDAVFIDRGEEARLPAILAKSAGKPVLTLGYSPGLAKRGVMVNFYLESSKIRFEVNTGRTKEAGLAISSHLLGMAKIVD